MGQLFSRLRIMQRIVLALLVPSLGLALAAAVIVIEKRTTVTDMQRLSSLAGLATHISGLVHDMQRERGASAVFIGSRGQQLVRELPEQRQLTDAQRKKLSDALAQFDARAAGGDLADILSDARSRVDRLDGMRQEISGLKIPAPDSNAYFTTTILRLLDATARFDLLVGLKSAPAEHRAATFEYVGSMFRLGLPIPFKTLVAALASGRHPVEATEALEAAERLDPGLSLCRSMLGPKAWLERGRSRR